MKTNRVLIIAIIIAFTAQTSYSELSKESIYSELKKQYNGINSIEFSFSSLENPYFKGSIKAKTGDKYVISMPGRDIICNGETIWNVTTEDNKTVISNFEDTGEGSLSIENLFFHFLDNYKPSRLVRENSSKGINRYVLTLVPDGSDNKFGDYKKIRLWLSINDFEIEKVELTGDYEINTYVISNINRNRSIPADVFVFDPPEDMEIIDIR